MQTCSFMSNVLCILLVDVDFLGAQTYAVDGTGTSRFSCHVSWLDALLNTCSDPEALPSTNELRGILQIPSSIQSHGE